MQSLKVINDISDDTFNEFLKSFSFGSKRFMVLVRNALKEQGVVLSTKTLRVSFSLFEDIENSSDPLLVFLRENEHQYENEIKRFVHEMKFHLFYLNALTQRAFENKAFKKEYFQTLHKTIESALIELGYTFESTEYTQKVKQQLLDLIQSNLTPERALQPNEIANNFFLHDMLNKLADIGYISKEFKNEKTQIYWINRAFNVDFYTEWKLEYFQLKMDWNNLNNLADWLLFLKTSCIVYKYKDNKQLLDWVIEHISYKGQEFSKDAIIYESLKRAIKHRKQFIGFYFKIDQNKLVKIQ